MSRPPPTEAERRNARQAAALRANLRRRKARERASDEKRDEIPDRIPDENPDQTSNVAREVLEFWFGRHGDPGHGLPRQAWFEKNPTFDEEIRRRFAGRIEDAGAGGLDPLAEFPDGALAVTILLDQFPRNLFRGSPRAFAYDRKALATARRAVERGFDRLVVPVGRTFFYLPFEHSEDLADQERGVELFRALPEVPWRAEQLDYALRHRDIIARFGRFPHRNTALGRVSTPEEIAFLAQPGSSF